MWSATFVDPPFLFAHFCRPFSVDVFVSLSFLDDTFSVVLFTFQGSCLIPGSLGAVGFLLLAFGVFLWIFKNEVQRGLTT